MGLSVEKAFATVEQVENMSVPQSVMLSALELSVSEGRASRSIPGMSISTMQIQNFHQDCSLDVCELTDVVRTH